MKICFIGCVQSSVVLFQTLLEHGKQIAGVVTRGSSAFNADFQSLAPLCRQQKIPFICEEEADKGAIEAFIRDTAPDVIYCFGWSKLLSEEILQIPPMGGIGFHPAALPNNRGRHPLIWALALGLSETASTFFKMTPEADAGDIISQVPIMISPEDDAGSLYRKVTESAARQVIEFTEYAEKTGRFPYVRANAGGNSWRKRGKEDGRIDWRMSAESIYNLIRALTYPYVGAHFCHQGEEYKVWRAEVWREPVAVYWEPGRIIKVSSDRDFVVKTGEGAVHILDCDNISLREGGYLL